MTRGRQKGELYGPYRRGDLAGATWQRKARVRAGLTLEQLAAKAEVNIKTVVAWERGRPVKPITEQRIGQILGPALWNVAEAADGA